MRRFYALFVVCFLLALPAVLLGQDTTHAAPVVPNVSAIAAFLATYAMGIATIGGSLIILGLSHAWAGFNGLSVNADGTPSMIGTFIKRVSVALACGAIMLLLHVAGVAAPAALTSAIGDFWSFVFETVGSAITGAIVYKAANLAPAVKP